MAHWADREKHKWRRVTTSLVYEEIDWPSIDRVLQGTTRYRQFRDDLFQARMALIQNELKLTPGVSSQQIEERGYMDERNRIRDLFCAVYAKAGISGSTERLGYYNDNKQLVMQCVAKLYNDLTHHSGPYFGNTV